MKPRLWPNALPMPGETLISNAGRNAVLNKQVKGVSAFCTDIGLTYFGLVDGVEVQIARFADLLGVDQSRFDQGVIRRNDRSWSIRGERLLASSLRRRRLHVCPACIREDIDSSDLPPAASAYCRSHWLLDAIRICPVHRFELAALQVVRKHGEHDFTARIAPYLDAPEALPSRRVQQDYRFQNYLLERLDKKGTSAGFLDRLEFHVAARVCELLGLTMMFGKTRKLETFSNTDWLEAGELGFSYASEPGGFQSAMSELQRRYRPNSKDGAFAVYGRLYGWVVRGREDSSFAPIRDLLRDHIVTSMPIGAGEVVLGEVVNERKIHSIRSASLAFRIHPTVIRRVLRTAGCLPASTDDKPDTWSLFDAKQHSGLLEDLRSAIPLSAVSRYLGTSREVIPMLVRASLIKPFAHASSEHRIPQDLFLPRKLDALLIKLFQRTTSVDSGNERGLVDLGTAARHSRVSIIEMVELVLKGDLKTVRRAAGPLSFSSIRVDADETRSFFLRNIRKQYKIQEAAQKLQVDPLTIRVIIQNKIIRSTVSFNPKLRINQHFLDADSLDEFVLNYRSLLCISRQMRTNKFHTAFATKKLLANHGIKPALTRAEAGQLFYLRSDLGSGEIKFGRVLMDGVWQDSAENLFILNDTQMACVNRFLAPRYQKEADRRVISGIVHVIANGLYWARAPEEYGSPSTLLQRFVRGSRGGIFDRVFHALADRELRSDRIVITPAHLQSQRTAARLLKAGLFPLVSREKEIRGLKPFRSASAGK